MYIIETDPLTFSGDEYVEYELPDGLKETSSNDIAFRFKTTQPDGVMMVAKNGNDHLMIELYLTIIRMSINLGGGILILCYSILHYNTLHQIPSSCIKLYHIIP